MGSWQLPLQQFTAEPVFAKPTTWQARPPLHRTVTFAAFLDELFRFLFQANLQRLVFGNLLFCGKLADVLGNPHGTEMRAAHGAYSFAKPPSRKRFGAP